MLVTLEVVVVVVTGACPFRVVVPEEGAIVLVPSDVLVELEDVVVVVLLLVVLVVLEDVVDDVALTLEIVVAVEVVEVDWARETSIIAGFPCWKLM